MIKKFKMIDESFICKNCGKSISPLGYTARDHCPYCLYSQHIDVNPGDRMESCQGLLEPVGLEKGKKGFKIVYKCKICGKIKKNIAARDDNDELIIKLSNLPI